MVVGDLHINSTIGLVVPTTNLDDGGTYRSSKGQRWLWRNWLSFWDEVSTVAEKHKASVWTVFNGDLVSVMVKHMTSQVITLNNSDIFDMVIDTIEPALDVSDKNFIVRGTAAHSGLSGWFEEQLSKDIGAEQSDEENNHSWWELLLECEGVLYDITHHGSMGRKAWTKANALNSMLAELIIKYRNRRCPDVALRSHNHRYARSDDSYGVEAYGLPAWELKTEFVYRLGIIEKADIGGFYFINKNGEYHLEKKRYYTKDKRAWRPSRRKT